jgi:hypothetical protein
MKTMQALFAVVKLLAPSITVQVANKGKASTFHTERRKTKLEGRDAATVAVSVDRMGGGLNSNKKEGSSSIFFFLLHGFDLQKHFTTVFGRERKRVFQLYYVALPRLSLDSESSLSVLPSTASRALGKDVIPLKIKLVVVKSRKIIFAATDL